MTKFEFGVMEIFRAYVDYYNCPQYAYAEGESHRDISSHFPHYRMRSHYVNEDPVKLHIKPVRDASVNALAATQCLFFISPSVCVQPRIHTAK